MYPPYPSVLRPISDYEVDSVATRPESEIRPGILDILVVE